LAPGGPAIIPAAPGRAISDLAVLDEGPPPRLAVPPVSTRRRPPGPARRARCAAWVL